MKPNELPDDVRKAIDELSRGVESALQAARETPHLHAASVSSIAEDEAERRV